MFPFSLLDPPVFRVRRPDPFMCFFDDILGPPLPGRFGIPRPPYLNIRFRVSKKPQKQKQEEKQSIFESVRPNRAAFNPKQGQYWACMGNEAYKDGNYPEAILNFNKAIEMTDHSECSFFRYRGLAFKKNGNIEPALKDAFEALQLDETNIKAQLLCGQLLAERGKKSDDIQDLVKAITRLTKARSLCTGQKKEHYQDELSKYIYRAKKLLWYKTQEIMNKQEIEGLKNKLKEEGLQEEDKKKIQEQIDQIQNSEIQQKQIPSYLTCTITQEIMEDPVVTSVGQTYEREALMKSIKTNGLKDPNTNEKISQEVYRNYAVRQAAQEFLLNNPWAFEYVPQENYMDIQF